MGFEHNRPVNLEPAVIYHDGVRYTIKEANVRNWSLNDAITAATTSLKDRRRAEPLEICLNHVPMGSDLDRKYLTLIEMNQLVGQIVDQTIFYERNPLSRKPQPLHSD